MSQHAESPHDIESISTPPREEVDPSDLAGLEKIATAGARVFAQAEQFASEPGPTQEETEMSSSRVAALKDQYGSFQRLLTQAKDCVTDGEPLTAVVVRDIQTYYNALCAERDALRQQYETRSQPSSHVADVAPAVVPDEEVLVVDFPVTPPAPMRRTFTFSDTEDTAEVPIRVSIHQSKPTPASVFTPRAVTTPSREHAELEQSAHERSQMQSNPNTKSWFTPKSADEVRNEQIAKTVQVIERNGLDRLDELFGYTYKSPYEVLGPELFTDFQALASLEVGARRQALEALEIKASVFEQWRALEHQLERVIPAGEKPTFKTVVDRYILLLEA